MCIEIEKSKEEYIAGCIHILSHGMATTLRSFAMPISPLHALLLGIPSLL